MARANDIPQFGILQGVRVAFSAISIAGPFACSLMADWGANVIWIENTAVPDVTRSGTAMSAEHDRRNMRNISLDIASPDGRKVFVKLIADIDIFICAAKGGQYEKWGLTDEVLWEINPKLVIVRVSGYGQTGLKEYTSRASYDPIGQAIGGMMYLNARPDVPIESCMPSVADYYTGLITCCSSLAAYIHAQRTGKGESMDLAQYEAVLRCMANFPLEAWNDKRKFIPGNFSGGTAAYSSYMCKDGNYVYILLLGVACMKKALPLLGLQLGTEEFPAGMPVYRKGTPGGDKLEATVKAFCMQHTAEEVETIFNENDMPCNRILNFHQMLDHPQFKARDIIVKYEATNGEEITTVNVVPKMKNNPSVIWRPTPTRGMDNEDILSDLGFSTEEINALYQAKAIFKA